MVVMFEKKMRLIEWKSFLMTSNAAWSSFIRDVAKENIHVLEASVMI